MTTQTCNTCHETKTLELFHANSSRKGRRPRCRACDARNDNRPARIRCRTTPRTIACGFEECLGMYITESGAGQHRIRAHGIYAMPRVGSARDLTATQTTELAVIRRRAVRGSGEGNIDSAGLLDLLFVAGIRRTPSVWSTK